MLSWYANTSALAFTIDVRGVRLAQCYRPYRNLFTSPSSLHAQKQYKRSASKQTSHHLFVIVNVLAAIDRFRRTHGGKNCVEGMLLFSFLTETADRRAGPNVANLHRKDFLLAWSESPPGNIHPQPRHASSTSPYTLDPLVAAPRLVISEREFHETNLSASPGTSGTGSPSATPCTTGASSACSCAWNTSSAAETACF